MLASYDLAQSYEAFLYVPFGGVMKAVCSVVIFLSRVALVAISVMALFAGALSKSEFVLALGFSGAAVGGTFSAVMALFKE